jgi:hypothetical protein
MLRAISFSIPSSTELQVIFNDRLSSGLGKNNFSIESVSGNVSDLNIRKVEVFDDYVIITTSPQVAGNFYILTLKDSEDSRFITDSGIPLVNDDVSRELFFVGLKKYNPVLDRMNYNVPKVYNLENSNASKIISAQAEEIFQAQKDLGKVLSNNYISVPVIDERRVRSSGATDRLLNEGVYEISRISSQPTVANLLFDSISYSIDSEIPRHNSFPGDPVSMQEVFVKEEEISLETEDNFFEGFLLSLSHKNIIKVLRVVHIKPEDKEDCYGNIGTEYSINTCKYSLLDNKYDKEYSFKNINLDSNQVLLSAFGNIKEPVLGDRIVVSYLYKDHSIRINEDSIEVYNLGSVSSESLPTNSTRFFLENAPIVNIYNDIPESQGVSFESNDGPAKPFLKELVYNVSKLPSEPGEYTINYATGEVIVAGENKVGDGTGASFVRARYLYRNIFSKNLDYYIKDGDIVPSDNRSLAGESATIDFNYEKVYVEGIDYEAPCHREVLNEHIENNFESAFVVKPKNTPITDVHRIFNQTTGEAYSLLYHTSDEVHFSGKRSPEIKTEKNEPVSFSKVNEEKISPSGAFVCPAFTAQVKSNDSNSNIKFSPGIPAELISENSMDYFIRSKGLLGEDEVSDLQIRFFGEPSSGNLINSVAISPTSSPPSLKERITMGPRVFRFELENNFILSNNLDSIGSHVNSSVRFGDKEFFRREKFFEHTGDPASLERSGGSAIAKVVGKENTDIFFENMSRLRNVGDYSVDYYNGIIYVAVAADADYRPIRVDYWHGKINNFNKNIISLTGAYKKISSADSASNANRVYDKLKNTSEFSRILDLEQSLITHVDGVVSLDSNSDIRDACIVLEDYTVLTPMAISNVRGVYDPRFLKGDKLSSADLNIRVEDINSNDVNSMVFDGGANVFGAKNMSYHDSIIDLKVNKRIRTKQESNNLVLEIEDEHFSGIYDIRHVKTGEKVFDEKLNIDKISDIDIVYSKSSGDDEAYFEIRTGVDLSEVDEEDFVLDSAGNRFAVLSVDLMLSRVTVSSPAINNSTAEYPELGSGKIVVKAVVHHDLSGVKISVPVDSFISRGDLIDVSYVQEFVPEPGTKVFVDCSYGSLYIDYLYAYDDVYISYEYGDNEVDWSKSNVINEGEEYYVSYKYGASRRALKDNFGVLTKIPYFQRFPLEADREVYRSGLQGVMSAFSNGAMKPSFETLVESFTDIKPNIEESFFGNWILGRDNLTPEEIKVKGSLGFHACKFNEGIYIDKDTVISTPALSNLNLDEGTISAWIAPDWAGIDNDAELTIEIDNLGEKEYRYRLGNDIFDYESGFSTFSSNDIVGAVDLTGNSITIHNFTSSWVDDSHSDESLSIGAFAIKRVEKAVDRATKMELKVSLRVPEFSPPKNITPPRRKPSEDIAASRTSLGLMGLGKSLSDASKGMIGAGAELESIRFCSPAFISCGDDHKLFMAMFNVVPVINDKSGRIYTFRVGYEHIDRNKFPKYDRPHITRNCFCSVDDTLSELSRFRDKDFNTVKVELDFEIDLSYMSKITSFIDKKASAFRVVDSTGSVFEVCALIGKDGDIYTDAIPDIISGFHVSRIPGNKSYITALGSEAINSTMPVGEITLLYQTMSILTNGAKNSEKYLNYSAKNYMLDWMSDYVSLDLSRDPSENIVTLKVADNKGKSKQDISLFYSDLIYSDQEYSIFNHLNLDKWFNIVDGNVSVDNAKSLAKGIAVGTLDKTSASIIDIGSLYYKVYNRFSLKDVYIGSAATNPSNASFVVSKEDEGGRSVGIPYNVDSEEGIFIGYDNACKTLLSDELGQWVFRTRASDSTILPAGVVAKAGGGFAFEYEKVPLETNFSGRINTNGEFSSVVRSNRIESDFGCPTDILCSARYRYCGEDVLEKKDGGWVKLEESDSTLINTLIGGQEGHRSTWSRHGSFKTSAKNGVYRMGESTASVDNEMHNIKDGNFVYTRLPCYQGNYEATVNFKVPDADQLKPESDGLGMFSGVISGHLTGMAPIHIYDEEINLKISLAKSHYNQPLLVMLNGETNEIVDISYFDWNSFRDCSLTVSKDSEAGSIIISSDFSIISRLSTEDVPADKVNGCAFLNEPFFAIHLFDASSSDIELFHSKASGNILDISLIEFSGISKEVDYSLEDGDIFITTDSKIEFDFKNIPSNETDGYADAYGYVEDIKYDIDEICFTSDKLRYLVDTGEDSHKGRLSVFKDGKGFLNFRIIDAPKASDKSPGVFNIATSIKHFKPGELHHVAASWRLNTLYEKDEMHLFIDGLEAPNLYRFGGPVKTRVNDKFSDISKEVLQDFTTDDIEYSQVFSDGVILAGTTKFISKEASFNKDMIGRSILLLESELAQSYVGGEYIISSVDGDEVTLVGGSNLDIVTFDVSASNIAFSFPPTAGLKKKVNTDLKNSEFALYRTSCDQKEVEFGGVHYYVDKGEIIIVSGKEVINPLYRANVETRIIEFIGRDDNCKHTDSIRFSDLNIHIKTFGLKFALFKEKINLSSSSYFGLDKISSDPNSGKSVLLSHAAEPVSLDDVSIRRIVIDRVIPDTSNVYYDGRINAEFEIDLEKGRGTHKLTSDSGRVHKQNLGRYLTINFDSDNAIFCGEIDGYVDGYSGTIYDLPDSHNIIKVMGETIDGSGYEEFNIRKNGSIRGKKLFTKVHRIVGSIEIADPNYEPFVLEVVESDDVSKSNNGGEHAEVFRYINGSLILTAAGSSGFHPFELHPGNYMVRYPAHLSVNIPQVGRSLYIGCDLEEGGQFGGIIDDFRIISEMSSDTRPSQRATTGTRSITEDFYNPNSLCADDQTLLLAHFDSPIKEQSRKLRQKVFLDEKSNLKYKMDLKDREKLLAVVNNKEEFESKMLRMGFDRGTASRVFAEVHHAQGGPIFNEARFRRSDDMLVSSKSVNEAFGISAKFFDTSPLIIGNKSSYFRRDEGTIEMWVSPLLDTLDDSEERYFLDIYSVTKKRVMSTSPNIIQLPTSAKKILKIELLRSSSEFSQFMLESEADKVFLDEVYRSKVTGRLTGGTGVEKDFSVGCRLSPDGRRVTLQSALPGSSVDVIISYIPVDSSGERVSIYKNKKSQIVFSIESDGKTNSVAKDIDWSRNTWHRIACTYKANSSSDYMKMFVDGVDATGAKYGESGLLYGSGMIYGQEPGKEEVLSRIKVSLKDDFRAIALGADIFGDYSALSRMDNIRFSRIARAMPQDPSGKYIDNYYSSNIDTVLPVLKDEATTLLVGFEEEGGEDSYAMVVDPASGIFNFDIEVLDYFSKINDDMIEDLIVQLVNRLKPAHTNAVVVFPRESC